MNSNYRRGHYSEGWDRQPIQIPHFPKAKILVLLERTQPCLTGWQRSLCDATLVECARICPLAFWESFSQGGIASEMLCRAAGAGSCWHSALWGARPERDADAVGVCPGGIWKPGNQGSFPPAMSVESPLLRALQWQLANKKDLKGPVQYPQSRQKGYSWNRWVINQ